MADKRFKYSLDALLRKHGADWKMVKAEEVTASQVVERCNRDLGSAKDGVDQTEQHLRDAYQGGATIDVGRHEMLAGYLTRQRALLEQRYRELSKAEDVHSQVRQNLEGIGRNIKSLEKHRETKIENHRFEQNSLELKRMDELWLLRKQNKDEG